MTFGAGMAVRVRLDWPETRGRCHVRTPHYLRGKAGRIVRHLGNFPNPEDLAFARPASTVPLYHVRFSQAELWPGDDPWPRAPGDEVIVELYEHWIEAA